jgi:hypothetical protein
MIRLKKTILALMIFFGITPLVFAVEAASLKFNNSTATVSNGGTFQIQVIVDPGSDSINSADVYVTYDGSLLKATGVSAGTLFPTVTNDVATSGTVYIAGMVNDPANSVSASGTIATITFQALKEGSGTLSFDCNSSKVVKNDINATNVLTCTANGTSAITVGSGSSGGSDPTATPTTGASDNGGTDDSTPTELPQTGIWDNVAKLAIPGAMLLLIGGALRLIL